MHSLLALLLRDASADKIEVKRLLHRHHDHLLRTLERVASPDQGSGTPKRPAFPAPTAATPIDAVSNEAKIVAEAGALLQVDEDCAATMLAQLKRHAYNDAHVRATEASASVMAAELLRADLSLLNHAHEQRCLLLRCVHQLLAIAYDVEAELHAVACGAVALLLQA